VSGISGLNSYRNAIRRLEFDFTRAPQKAELQAAAVDLMEPLVRRDRARARELIDEARRQVAEFWRRSSMLPPTEVWLGQKPITDPLLQNFEERLAELAQLNDDDGADSLQYLADRASGLVAIARQVPDPVMGMTRRLKAAKDDYRNSLVAVWTASGVAFLLFL